MEPEALYSIYSLSDGIAKDYDSADTIEEAYDIYTAACDEECQESLEQDSEISVHLYDPHYGNMIAESVYRHGKLR